MKTNVNSIILNYRKEGQGAPLILLHGNGEDHHIFDKLIEELRTDFTVYAIDSRNHGESSMTDQFSYEAMAEDIYQFIKSCNIEKPAIVGFSDGSIISLLIAIKHKNIFDKMIWLGINLKPTDFKKEIYDEIVFEYEQTKNPLIKMMLEEPNIELEELSTIETKTLVVSGEHDLFNEEMVESIVKTMPNAKLKIMKEHDHASYIVDQNILDRDLKAFLKNV